MNISVGVGTGNPNQNIVPPNQDGQMVLEYRNAFNPLVECTYIVLAAIIVTAIFSVDYIKSGNISGLGGLVAVIGIITSAVIVYVLLDFMVNKRVAYKFYQTGFEVEYGNIVKHHEHFRWDQIDRYEVKRRLSARIFGINKGNIVLIRASQSKAVEGAFKSVVENISQKEDGKEILASAAQAFTAGLKEDQVHQSETEMVSIGSGEESGSFLARILGGSFGEKSRRYIHPYAKRSRSVSGGVEADRDITIVHNMPDFVTNSQKIIQLATQYKNNQEANNVGITTGEPTSAPATPSAPPAATAPSPSIIPVVPGSPTSSTTTSPANNDLQGRQ